MTIPKRTSELLEEQGLDAKEAGLLGDIGTDLGLAGVTALGVLGTPFTGGASDVAAAGIDAGLIGADAAATGAAAATDAAATGAAADAAPSGLVDMYGKSIPSTATSDAASSSGQGGLMNWIKNKGKASLGAGVLGRETKSLSGNGQTSTGGTPGLAQGIGPYGGNSGGGGPIQVGRMLAGSKEAASTMEMEILEKVKDIPRLLEMILETICGCGQPTPGKFNGMPHCLPGSGCSESVAFSKTNPTGDHCCSCGNPNCSGSFHGQPVCAPGQGCNAHWDDEKGARKWNPAMETPSEKIEDHDNWASATNHGEFEMPDGDGDEDDRPQTTWE